MLVLFFEKKTKKIYKSTMKNDDKFNFHKKVFFNRIFYKQKPIYEISSIKHLIFLLKLMNLNLFKV